MLLSVFLHPLPSEANMFSSIWRWLWPLPFSDNSGCSAPSPSRETQPSHTASSVLPNSALVTRSLKVRKMYQQILVSSLIVLAKPLLMIFFLPGSPHSPASTRPKIGNENSPSPGQTVTFRHLTNVPTPLRSWRAYWMTSKLFTLGVLTLLGKRPWQV